MVLFANHDDNTYYVVANGRMLLLSSIQVEFGCFAKRYDDAIDNYNCVYELMWQQCWWGKRECLVAYKLLVFGSFLVSIKSVLHLIIKVSDKNFEYVRCMFKQKKLKHIFRNMQYLILNQKFVIQIGLYL